MRKEAIGLIVSGASYLVAQTLVIKEATKEFVENARVTREAMKIKQGQEKPAGEQPLSIIDRD